jgi:MbtH protein
MATNPFEDEDANYYVLINDEGQHSLWPVFADVPDGWEIIFGEEKRQACLDFIEQNWTDMRPKSLIRQMEADAAARANDNGGSSDGGSGNGASGNGASGNGAAKKKAPARKK